MADAPLLQRVSMEPQATSIDRQERLALLGPVRPLMLALSSVLGSMLGPVRVQVLSLILALAPVLALVLGLVLP